jgi:chitinase
VDFVVPRPTLLTFTPGQTSKPVSVPIVDDGIDENDEFFRVYLARATGAAVVDSHGVGTLQHDDALPTLAIGDASLTEGDSASKTMTFTLTLAPPSGRVVSVTATTATGAPCAPSDYKTQLLTFQPGQASKAFNVSIKGDLVAEPSLETFIVDLSGETSATLADGQADTIEPSGHGPAENHGSECDSCSKSNSIAV